MPNKKYKISYLH